MDKTKGKIEVLRVKSEFLKEELEVMVYLPSTFSPLYKHQVLIAQDGQDYFRLGKITSTYEELFEQGKVNPTIIVGVPYNNIEDRMDKYYPSGVKIQAYIRFLGEELVPLLDQNYPTFQIGTGRILLGDSLAATVSLMTALEYPHTFGKLILQSPYVNNNVLEVVQKFAAHHLIEVYHIVGLKETDVFIFNNETVDFLQLNRRLHQFLVNKQISTFYNEGDGDHTWAFWQPDLVRALVYMLN